MTASKEHVLQESYLPIHDVDVNDVDVNDVHDKQDDGEQGACVARKLSAHP